jgi:hypothetical protein
MSISSLRRIVPAWLIIVALVAPVALLAQGNTGGNTGNTGGSTGNTSGSTGNTGMLVNPLGSIDSLQDLIMAILKGVIQLGAIFLVLMLVFVGFKFVMAQGNEEELRSARAALLWTVIGGLILLGSQAIMTIVQDTANSLR